MHKKSNLLILGSCLCFSITACNQTSSKTSLGLSPLSEITPTKMMLGKKQGAAAERCVYAVRVDNAKLACQHNNCAVQVFDSAPQTLQNGQRGLLVGNCTNDGSLPTGDLIADRGQTGDSGIMILQNRRLGDSLWKQTVLPNGDYAIELGTEAALGTLRFEQGKYRWDEEAD
ncbi:hypothetical protein NQT62_04030 [Limnobacter humi]|uniref:Lipoprotein n=1 Tax=Limnobacter humi TaxID=1778671 RepID=A0ABT1WF00_9BURK|nr:hypothetical protein [Limnobacter humi]MCQ8895611.1 hypothetical protein [Limnobacter humi]